MRFEDSCPSLCRCPCLFFFNDPATTEIYTLSLHDALPISDAVQATMLGGKGVGGEADRAAQTQDAYMRSEEHTSELQSRRDLVCRLLLEKKKNVGSSRTATKTKKTPRRSSPTSGRPTISAWNFPFFFFFNDTATTEIYTLSLHDALPISRRTPTSPRRMRAVSRRGRCRAASSPRDRKSTRLNSSHVEISYAVFCLKKKKKTHSTNLYLTEKQ